jgi:hypothetical protein
MENDLCDLAHRHLEYLSGLAGGEIEVLGIHRAIKVFEYAAVTVGVDFDDWVVNVRGGGLYVLITPILPLFAAAVF